MLDNEDMLLNRNPADINQNVVAHSNELGGTNFRSLGFLFTIERIDAPRNAIINRKTHFREDTTWHDVDLGPAVQGGRNKELRVDKDFCAAGGKCIIGRRSSDRVDFDGWSSYWLGSVVVVGVIFDSGYIDRGTTELCTFMKAASNILGDRQDLSDSQLNFRVHDFVGYVGRGDSFAELRC